MVRFKSRSPHPPPLLLRPPPSALSARSSPAVLPPLRTAPPARLPLSSFQWQAVPRPQAPLRLVHRPLPWSALPSLLHPLLLLLWSGPLSMPRPLHPAPLSLFQDKLALQALLKYRCLLFPSQALQPFQQDLAHPLAQLTHPARPSPSP